MYVHCKSISDKQEQQVHTMSTRGSNFIETLLFFSLFLCQFWIEFRSVFLCFFIYSGVILVTLGRILEAKQSPGGRIRRQGPHRGEGSISVPPFLAKNSRKLSQQGGPKSSKMEKNLCQEALKFCIHFWNDF